MKKVSKEEMKKVVGGLLDPKPCDGKDNGDTCTFTTGPCNGSTGTCHNGSCGGDC